MKKIYCLDTNVLVESADALYAFKEHTVVIPFTALIELDSLKVRVDSVGQNARRCIRHIDRLRELGSLVDGVKINKSGLLKVSPPSTDISHETSSVDRDASILETARKLNEDNKNVTLITNDVNMRLFADVLGIPTEGFAWEGQPGQDDSLYSGVARVTLDQDLIDEFYKHKVITLSEEQQKELSPHQFLVMKSGEDSQSAIARYRNQEAKALTIKEQTEIWGLKPRNKEQRFALDVLMDPKVKLVTLIGKAGSGKTLVAIAAGMEQCVEQKRYSKVIVSRPIQAMGKDIGFLPGDLIEKMAPWIQPIKDNLLFLLKGNRNAMDHLFENDTIEIEALTYIRGRSISNSYIIIDECLPGDTKISVLRDGEPHKMRLSQIHKRLHKRQETQVLSYDVETDSFEYESVTNSWERSKRRLLQIRCSNRKFRCTPNHKILTSEGWTEASQICVGDLVATTEPIFNQLLVAPNREQHQMILGSFLGDGHLDRVGLNRYRIRTNHCQEQEQYASWKGSLFNAVSKLGKTGGFNPEKPLIETQTETFGIKRSFPKTKTTCPQWVLDELTPLGLAIWYMDDGSTSSRYSAGNIWTCSFDEESQRRIAETLNKKWGIECKPQFDKNHDPNRKAKGYWKIVISVNGLNRLSELIAPFMHNSMTYKILPEYRLEASYQWQEKINRHGWAVVDSISDGGEEIVYDIEVSKNHNFVVESSSRKMTGGIIVHNCQNLSAMELKAIITRVGDGTKIVLTGDIEQIDNPYFDPMSNGLTYIIEKFKNQDLAGHIKLIKGERSPLATLAAKIL